jgi:uncharacterized RDD family membrane protein YckC
MNAIASAKAASAAGPELDNRRVLAGVIDVVIVALGAAVIFAAAGTTSAPLVAVALGWGLYYYFACESSDSAQTVGKRVMKIRVETVNGGKPDMRAIALRTVLRVVDGIGLYVVGLIVMIATGKRRGRLGDLVADTRIGSAGGPAKTPVAAATAVAAAPAASRVPIAESGPAFAPVADADELEDEPVAEAGEAPVAEVEDFEQEPVAEVEDDSVAEADEEPVAEADEVEDEPVAEPEDEPVAEGEQDTVDMASPSLKELAADVEATAGSAPDEEEPAEEPVAQAEPVDEDLVDDDPLADPDGEEEDEDDLAPAAEVDEDEDEDAKRIETISAIDLVMEDSQRKS